ncbi:uncharacterized protein LOC111062855 isoform X2 [Nilaparvata lugens]|uniref:uncharacterized protein LOC111062855 isoform X2 n=1 Tax=Nilaparvata lugens TaxID=108931 RepID=UPI000B996F25|nr:uncharacterized protein LOC111062855 isoform X2 [Nilaparvata lugens]
MVHGKQTPPSQTPRGKEIFLLTLAIISMMCIVFELHANMADDWTVNANSRTRVLVLAVILFLISIVVCYYTINRLGVQPCNPSRDQGNLGYSDSSTSLLSYDMPPCYDSIKLNIQFLPPPAYNEVNLQVNPIGMLETAHDKATG